jgi:hypothetical protein
MFPLSIMADDIAAPWSKEMRAVVESDERKEGAVGGGPPKDNDCICVNIMATV